MSNDWDEEEYSSRGLVAALIAIFWILVFLTICIAFGALAIGQWA